VRGRKVGDGILAFERTSDEYVAMGCNGGYRCIGSQVFAEIYHGVFGSTFSVCVEYLVAFGIVDVIPGCGCHYVPQLEVRDESTGSSVDPSKLEEALCIRC
jgi:hypothetical protein